MNKTLLLLCLMTSFSILAQDPVVQNDAFAEIPKEPGTSDCSCSHWINKDLGDQGETSASGLTSPNSAVKFDDFESDLIYQEVEVLANTNYKLTYAVRFNDGADPDVTPSSIEMRILKGSGYESGYTPVYYTDATIKPTSGFGYIDITVAELAANNIAIDTQVHPGNSDYLVYEFDFNSGSETSIAIMGRGIGRPNTPPADASDSRPWLWSSGEDEIRVDYLTVINQDALSIQEFSAANLKVYPNPAKSNITIISSNQSQVDSVELYNILGSKLKTYSSLVDNTINISEMSSGIYLLKVNSGNNTVTKRILIE